MLHSMWCFSFAIYFFAVFLHQLSEPIWLLLLFSVRTGECVLVLFFYRIFLNHHTLVADRYTNTLDCKQHSYKPKYRFCSRIFSENVIVVISHFVSNFPQWYFCACQQEQNQNEFNEIAQFSSPQRHESTFEVANVKIRWAIDLRTNIAK